MINKYMVLTILSLVWALTAFWVFNHINVWAGIGFGVLGLMIAVSKINKKLKK